MRTKRSGWSMFALSVVVGVSVAARLYVTLVNQGIRVNQGVSDRLIYAGLAVAGVLAGLLMHFVVLGWLRNWLQRRLPLWQVALPSLSLLAGLALFMQVPQQLPPFPGDPIQEIVVRATGDKNPAASNREIWFRGIELADGRRINAGEFEYSDNWWPRGNALLSTGQPQAEAVWRGRVSGPVRLFFDRHTHAGIVQVEALGEVTSYDLYSDDALKGAYTIAFPAPHVRLAQAYRVVLYGGAIVTNAVGLYVTAGGLGLLLAALGARILPHRWRQERLWSLAIIRVASIVVLMGFVLSLGRASGIYSLRGYWERAWQPAKERTKPRQMIVHFRDFLREKLPAEALVLASAVDGAELTMAYPCHVMHTHPIGIAWFNHKQYLADYELLLDADLPWDQRRELLQRYGLRWVYFSKSDTAKHTWLAKVASDHYPVRGHILFHLPPASELPVELNHAATRDSVTTLRAEGAS